MIGKTISHYKILEKLGEGGMGVVYKAEDLKLERTVALKFLPPELTRDRDAKTRFVHEAKAASALQHHNICTVHEIDETSDGHLFIAMDCYEGETLKEKVERGPLPLQEAIDFVSQIAEGLSESHAAGMVHRDVKPANVMVTRKGVAKILDFGLAKLAGMTKVTKTGATVGTLAYMSPEQAQGLEVDHRTDIWSLGVVLYELLTGQTPFKGDHEAAMVYSIMNQDVAPPSDLASEVPAEINSIVAKMLQKNPNDRYATANELLSDLRKVQTGAAVKVALPMSRKAKRVTWGLSAVLVIAAVVISLLFLDREPSTVAVRTLAVVDFDIISGEEASHLAAGLAEGISVKLSRVFVPQISILACGTGFPDSAIRTWPFITPISSASAILGYIQCMLRTKHAI